MGFVLKTAHHFWWPVTVNIPSDGKLESHNFSVCFEALTHEAFIARQKELENNPIPDPAQTDISFLERIAVDWRDVKDEHGNDVPFSKEAIRQAAQFAWFRLACFDAYHSAITGNVTRH